MKRPENVPTVACNLAEEIVRSFGELRLRVFGTSMVPSILPGDLISVQRASVSDISRGDVVLYSREGRMFAHRVVACMGSPEEPLKRQEKPHLITRGDRLSYNDAPVCSGELLGRVVSLNRGHRQIPLSAQSGGANGPLLRLLRTSDRATYLYLRVAALWGRFVDRRFRSDNQAAPGEGLLGPEGSGAKSRDSLAINVGAKTPVHKLVELIDAGDRTRDNEGVAECQA
jgi:signal peptidase I